MYSLLSHPTPSCPILPHNFHPFLNLIFYITELHAIFSLYSCRNFANAYEKKDALYLQQRWLQHQSITLRFPLENLPFENCTRNRLAFFFFVLFLFVWVFLVCFVVGLFLNVMCWTVHRFHLNVFHWEIFCLQLHLKSKQNKIITMKQAFCSVPNYQSYLPHQQQSRAGPILSAGNTTHEAAV